MSAEEKETITPLDANFRIELPVFEGPLDLLLHLIQKHELDILDLPIAFVTERYLSYLGLMKQLNLDIASEYLLMAATLAHIKSKMLLPTPPVGQDEDGIAAEELDPRAELIRRLLEYQKYKAAAENLGARGVAGRDVFTRGSEIEEASGPAPLAEIPLFQLLDAFQKVVTRAKLDLAREINAERITIQERMTQIVERLKGRAPTEFDLLFDDVRGVYEVVVTFLALLEMAKMRMARVFQTEPAAPLYIELAVSSDDAIPRGPITSDGGDAAHVPVEEAVIQDEQPAAVPAGASAAADGAGSEEVSVEGVTPSAATETATATATANETETATATANETETETEAAAATETEAAAATETETAAATETETAAETATEAAAATETEPALGPETEHAAPPEEDSAPEQGAVLELAAEPAQTREAETADVSTDVTPSAENDHVDSVETERAPESLETAPATNVAEPGDSPEPAHAQDEATAETLPTVEPTESGSAADALLVDDAAREGVLDVFANDEKSRDFMGLSGGESPVIQAGTAADEEGEPTDTHPRLDDLEAEPRDVTPSAEAEGETDDP